VGDPKKGNAEDNSRKQNTDERRTVGDNRHLNDGDAMDTDVAKTPPRPSRTDCRALFPALRLDG
jgi:hypothetical protein